MSEKADILIVDDEVSVREMLRVVLSGAGYTVRTVDSGEQCLEEVQAKAPSLILLDVYLGDMDGYDVVERLKQMPAGRDIPVIFLSAASEIYHRTRGLMSGAVDFITKPFHNAELLARVSTHLELRRLRIDLQRQAHGLRQANDSLQREVALRKEAEEETRLKNRELERFTYKVSHDLRSPLVTIRTFLPHLVEDLEKHDTETAARDMQLINNAADTMHALLEELLKLSRAGRGVRSPENLSLQAVVSDALALAAGRIKQRGVQVHVSGLEHEVRGERVRLVEVFQNLVDNAVKFMGDQPAPRIDIYAQQHGTEVRVVVCDNGMGVDPQQAGRVFEVFEKLDSAAEGAGMGLALVKRIVEVHGGRIWMESDGPGRGACVWVALPRE